MPDPLIVIGITGLARSGKDTIASHLVSRHGFARIALADGLRSAFSDLDGPTWELRKDFPEAGLSDRWALQTLGTECRQDLPDEAARLNHWCHLALIKIRYLSRYHPRPRRRIVIPDMRFAHEPRIVGEAIEAWGGKLEVWRVERAGAGLSGSTAAHVSETGQNAIGSDETIQNDATIGDLLGWADSLLQATLATP